MVTANGAVVHHDIPSPQSNGVPFLHLEPENDRFFNYLFLDQLNGNLMDTDNRVAPSIAFVY